MLLTISVLELATHALATTRTVADGTADSGGASALITAILGGAVGVVITALARGLGIPSDVRTHDAAIADQDGALATWIADRNYSLGKESKAIRDGINPDPGESAADGTSGAAIHAVAVATYNDQARKADIAIAALRGAALHEYRDQERRVRLERASILAGEGWAHRLWRRAAGDPAPGLEAPRKATPVLDSWRKQSQMSGERPVWPEDATKRTLDDAIAGVSALGP